MKKNVWDSLSVPKNRFFKILVCMKLTFALILILSLQLSAKVHSQTITLNIKNFSLSKALLEIEKKSSFRIIYNDDMLPKTEKFSINAVNEDVNLVLNKLLISTNLTYSLTPNNLIVIKVKEDLAPVNITGKVVDSNNQNLIGVSVKIKGTNKGTITDAAGNFEINVDDQSAVLVFTYLGFEQKELMVGNQRVINVTLV